MSSLEPIAKKTYYSVSEVSALTGLKAHVLRYWETQFDVISPSKNRGGTRVYQAEEIERILLVKQLLYERRFTIEGARQKLKEMRQEGKVAEVQKQNVGPAVLAAIKDGLEAVQDVLTLPESPRPAGGGVSSAGGGTLAAPSGASAVGGDAGAGGRDPATGGRDPGAGGRDPGVASRDASAARGDPGAAIRDASAARGDPEAASRDASATGSDPSAAEGAADPS